MTLSITQMQVASGATRRWHEAAIDATPGPRPPISTPAQSTILDASDTDEHRRTPSILITHDARAASSQLSAERLGTTETSPRLSRTRRSPRASLAPEPKSTDTRTSRRHMQDSTGCHQARRRRVQMEATSRLNVAITMLAVSTGGRAEE